QELYKDRKKFSEQVFKVASSDLLNMGISVVSYTLKDIKDDQVAPGGGHPGWGRSSGEAQRASRIPWGHLGGGTGVLSCSSSSSLRSFLGSSRSFHAPPAPAGVQVAKTKQQIEEEKAQVLVVERAQQVALQEQEVGRRERELEATVRKPAEAERYRLERLAEAQR
ncbi:FLOT1 protein, partial [Indicator maculatus]|nr:FLOT1 protein [Indicator maculatus]